MTPSLNTHLLIENRIYLIRGKKVMLDTDLAVLYGVTTFNLNKAVQRNMKRFPEDFMFCLTETEAQSLTFQIGISKTPGRGGRRTLPYAFTQEGIAMLSGVLRSDRAIVVNIQIMRTFVKLRDILLSHKDLAQKLNNLEKKYDHQFKAVFDAIRALVAERSTPRKQIIGIGGPD
ncbi:MAG: hypothetical protein A2428_09550 [Bdellovibrionales bacterium RIFOXYC1_FULL_54_43]|nr:MAG: hypothetical protein A2428_09550 [Bdellovibrionales bacterium RIFOXYC1_FULL_54_43]OFZ84207.1 MAG: hypothetical protein A2603_14620 [Bdellovibrionales bacterium RIFOXYD1_FULL_55_31]